MVWSGQLQGDSLVGAAGFELATPCTPCMFFRVSGSIMKFHKLPVSLKSQGLQEILVFHVVSLRITKAQKFVWVLFGYKEYTDVINVWVQGVANGVFSYRVGA